MKNQEQYKDFLASTTDALNAATPKPTLNEAFAILTKACADQGFNRKATSVRLKVGKFEVIAV
jgi:hypothetical protein